MSDDKNKIATIPQNQLVGIFADANKFDTVQRAATLFSNSSLVPDVYRGQNGIANCVVALEIADRIQMSPFMVMQNLDVIKGKPSWNAKFLIAAINTSGRFNPLKFKMTGKGDKLSCYAYTTEKGSDEILKGPEVDMVMAKAEGWVDKAGSKWKTMPQVMIRYRAASFFSRLYCPEIGMGLMTKDEIEEVEFTDVSEQRIEEEIEENANKEVVDIPEEVETEVVDEPEKEPEPKEPVDEKAKKRGF